MKHLACSLAIALSLQVSSAHAEGMRTGHEAWLEDLDTFAGYVINEADRLKDKDGHIQLPGGYSIDVDALLEPGAEGFAKAYKGAVDSLAASTEGLDLSKLERWFGRGAIGSKPPKSEEVQEMANKLSESYGLVLDQIGAEPDAEAIRKRGSELEGLASKFKIETFPW